MSLEERFKSLLKGKGLLAGIQLLCPIDLTFKLLANQKFQGKTHDIVVLLKLEGTVSLLKDPQDVQLFIENLLGERKSDTIITCAKARYFGQEYFAVFVDRPQTPQK